MDATGVSSTEGGRGCRVANSREGEKGPILGKANELVFPNGTVCG
jgi:hypothetical protein